MPKRISTADEMVSTPILSLHPRAKRLLEDANQHKMFTDDAYLIQDSRCADDRASDSPPFNQPRTRLKLGVNARIIPINTVDNTVDNKQE